MRNGQKWRNLIFLGILTRIGRNWPKMNLKISEIFDPGPFKVMHNGQKWRNLIFSGILTEIGRNCPKMPKFEKTQNFRNFWPWAVQSDAQWSKVTQFDIFRNFDQNWPKLPKNAQIWKNSKFLQIFDQGQSKVMDDGQKWPYLIFSGILTKIGQKWPKMTKEQGRFLKKKVRAM